MEETRVFEHSRATHIKMLIETISLKDQTKSLSASSPIPSLSEELNFK